MMLKTFSNNKLHTNTDICSNATHIQVSHLLLEDQLLQAGLGKLLVVKEG